MERRIMKNALNLVRDRPAFRRLWFGQIVSLLGDWLTYVAVSMLALEKGEGALAVAFVLVAHMLPNALLSPWAGSITDRFDRRTVMVASNWVQVGLTGFMVLGAATGAFLLVQAALVR